MAAQVTPLGMGGKETCVHFADKIGLLKEKSLSIFVVWMLSVMATKTVFISQKAGLCPSAIWVIKTNTDIKSNHVVFLTPTKCFLVP